jgi:hypothetical protein
LVEVRPNTTLVRLRQRNPILLGFLVGTILYVPIGGLLLLATSGSEGATRARDRTVFWALFALSVVSTIVLFIRRNHLDQQGRDLRDL